MSIGANWPGREQGRGGLGCGGADGVRPGRDSGDFSIAGLPLLAGLSRKSMVWKSLGISPSEALNGTTVLNTIALMKGADILRVHDVKEAVQLVKLIGMLRR